MTMSSDNNFTGGPNTNASSGRSGPGIALIGAAALAAVIVVFVLRNSDELELDFMLFNWDTTVRWAIFVSVVLGVALNSVVGIWWRRRRSTRNRND